MMIDRTKVPFNDKFPDFKFPEFRSVNLPNDIKLHLIEYKNQPLAAFHILIRDGAYSDNIEGLSYLTTQMLTRGTSELSANDIASVSENLGINIKVDTGYDKISLSAISLSENFEKCIELLSDCFLDSQFPANEFEKIKQKHIANIMQQNADISYLSKYALIKTAFKGNGYGKTISGTLKSLKNITRDLAYAHYAKLINNRTIELFLTGNFNADKIISMLTAKFKTFENPKTETEYKQVKIRHEGTAIINKPESNQSSIRIAQPTTDIKNPDYPYIQLINTIFGGFFMSRLNKILREEKGYTYGVYSQLDNRIRANLFVITTNVNIDKTFESVEIIKNEFDDLRKKPINEEEMTRAKRHYTGGFLRSIETPLQVSALVRAMSLQNLEKDFYDKLFKKISETKLKDLHYAVEKYFSDDKFVIAIAGNLEIIAAQTEEMNKIQIVEIE